MDHQHISKCQYPKLEADCGSPDKSRPNKRRLEQRSSPLTEMDSDSDFEEEPKKKKRKKTSDSKNASQLWKPFVFLGHELRPTRAFDKLVEWMNERQMLFNNRKNGLPPAQWTTNPVLRDYRFCNVYRFLDRCCQFLISEVIEHPGYSPSPIEVIFRVVFYTYFTKPETWTRMVHKLGGRGKMNWSNFEPAIWKRHLDSIKDQHGTLYTGAFQVPAPPREYSQVHEWHLDQIQDIMKTLPNVVTGAKYAADIVLHLADFRNMGDFISYQLFLNLSYAKIVGGKFHWNDVAVAGVGCRSGLGKIFGSSLEDVRQIWGSSKDDGDFERYLVRWFCQNQKEILNSDPRYIWKDFNGMKLHVEDWEHAICEMDKYCREVLPCLGTKTRIKVGYKPPSSRSVSIPAFEVPQGWKRRASIPPRPKCSPIVNAAGEEPSYILERISEHSVCNDDDGTWELKAHWKFWDGMGNEGDPTWEPLDSLPKPIIERYRRGLKRQGLHVPF